MQRRQPDRHGRRVRMGHPANVRFFSSLDFPLLLEFLFVRLALSLPHSGSCSRLPFLARSAPLLIGTVP
eukprot:1750261-Rhodomonas_salina.3